MGNVSYWLLSGFAGLICTLMILTIIFFVEDLLGTSFNAETNRMPTLKGKNNQKVAGSF